LRRFLKADRCPSICTFTPITTAPAGGARRKTAARAAPLGFEAIVLTEYHAVWCAREGLLDGVEVLSNDIRVVSQGLGVRRAM